MPISDEVIELAPVKKTKKTLIIMIVAIGLAVALAVTFLVMYLLKPNLPSDTTVVNGVTITNSTLFSSNDENGGELLTASIGNEYEINASISVGNGTSEAIEWEISPSDALIKVERGDGSLKFTPTVGYDGTIVTVKARSSAQVDKYAEISFKIVHQGTEVFIPTKYYSGSASSNAVTITDDKISIPYYSVAANNLTYTLLFDQMGEYNAVTGEYSHLTVVDETDNAVEASVSNDKILSIERTSYTSVLFKAIGEGATTLTLTAKSGKTHTFNVTVKSSDELGYIENIYFFDKAVVDEEFIQNYLLGDKLDIAKLNEDFVGKNKKLSTPVMNPEAWELPYTNETYNDIYSHILVNPVSVQYDTAKKELKENWYKNLTFSSSNASAIKPDDTAKPGNTVLITGALGAGQLTIEDRTPGSIRTSVKINYRVIAGCSTGSVTAQGCDTDGKPSGDIVGSGMSKDTLSVVPGQSILYNVKYTLSMPGNTKTESIVDSSLMNLMYKIDYDSDIFSVSLRSTSIVSGKETKLTNSDITFTRIGGSDTASFSTFEAAITFNVVVKETADTTEGDLPQIIFTKSGTQLSAEENWEVDKRDVQWSSGIKLSITAQAKDARFIDRPDAVARVTSNHTLAGNIIYRDDKKSADVYVQVLNANDALPFNIEDLVTATGDYSTTVTVKSTNNSFNKVTSSSGDKLTFTGYIYTGSAEVEVAVKSVDGSPIGTFSLYFNAIDGISSFETLAEASAYYGYSSSNQIQCDTSIAITNTVDNVVHRIKETSASKYTFDGIDLYYGSVVNDNFLLNKTSANGGYYYSYNGTNLFFYNNAQLNPVVDLYEFSYNNYINFTVITVKFNISSSDYYIGQFKETPDAPPASTKLCKFIRKADDIVLSKDKNFDTDKLLKTDGTEYPVNQDTENFLIVSSVVNIKDNDGIAKKVITEFEQHDYLVDRAVISIPNQNGSAQIDVVGDKVEGTTFGYYSLTYIVPKVIDTVNGDRYSFAISCTGINGRSYVISAQNKARGIASITLYSDKECTQRLDSLLFGKFNNGEIKNITIYIKITYVGLPERQEGVEYINPYDHFETAILTIPEYLTASADEFYLNDSDIDRVFATGEGEIFICEISLAEGYETVDFPLQGYELIVRQQTKPTTTERIQAKCGLSIDAGLKQISVKTEEQVETVAIGETKDVYYSFKVDSASKLNQSVSFDLIYDSLTAMAYDHSATGKLTYQISNVSVAGLTVNDNVRGVAPSIGFTIGGLSAPLDNATVTVVFTDITNGANVKFTVTFHISVVVEIYDVDVDGGDTVIITTSGNSAVAYSASKTLNVTINNGSVTPNSKALNVFVVDPDGAETTNVDVSYSDADQTITLKAVNSILSGEYYLVVKCGNNVFIDKTTNAKKIKIETTAAYIELDDDNNDVTVENVAGQKTANITVDKDHASFKLAAKIVGGVEGQTYNAIAYSLTSDKDSGKITVNNSGVITFADTITAQSGTISYRISYTDKNSAQTYTIDITVDYTVAIDTVTFDTSRLGDIYNDNAITLYYDRSTGAYTSLDLGSYITASNSKFTSVVFADPKTVTADSNVIDVASGTVLVPRGTTTTVLGDAIAINVGGVVCTGNYRVIVRTLAELTLTPSATAIDKSVGGTVYVDHNFASTNYSGLTCTYTLTAPDGFTVTGNKTVGLGSTEPVNGSYTVSAKATFGVASITGLTLNGTIEKTASFALDVNCASVYDGFEYDLKCGNSIVNPNENHYLGVDDTVHDIVIKNYTANSNVTYSLTVTGGIVEKSQEFSNGIAKVESIGNNYGQFTLTVTVKYNDETIRSIDKTYNFIPVDASAITAELKYDGTTVSGNAQNINDLKQFAYTVTGAPEGSTFDLHAYGDGVSFTVANNVMTVTVTKPASLAVYGTVIIGSGNSKYYVYLPERTVTLTATAPDFTAATDKSSITPTQQATLSVGTASGFVGDYTVTYTLKSGGDYATLVQNAGAKTATLTARNNVVSGGSVKVGVEINVTSGAYKGTYNLGDISVTVTGVALPEIKWNNAPTTISAGGSGITFTSSYYTLTGGLNANDVSITISADDTVLVRGTDYTFASNTLTVKSTDKTKAGGSITVTVTATVTGAVHTGVVVSDTYNIVISNPQLKDITATLDENYSCNLSGLIKPYVYDGSGWFVKSDDTVNIVSVSASSGVAVTGTVITLTDTSLSDVRLTVYYRITGGYYNSSNERTSDITVTFVKPITVTYNYNYDGAPDSEEVLYKSGSNYGSKWFIPERTGYTFKGWGESFNSTDAINGNTSVQTVTLYAIWEAKTYTVSFNANGGQGSVESATVVFGSDYSLPAGTELSREGYTLTGWGLTPTATVSVIKAETAGDHMLFAIWKADTYTIIYNVNGGNSGYNPGTITVEYGGTYADALNVTDPTRSSSGWNRYSFDGWFSAAGDGEQFTSNMIVNKAYVANNNTITMYAHWSSYRYSYYTVTYNANNGTILGSQTYAVEVNYTTTSVEYSGFKDYIPVRNGYEFVGWYRSRSDADSLGTPISGSITLSGNTTLYAGWRSTDLYTVTLDLRSGYIGDNTSYSVQLQNGSTFDAHNYIIPTRDGYKFVGWTTDDQNTTAAASSITVDSNITLYAHWQVIATHNVTLYMNDGTGSEVYSNTFENGYTFTLHTVIVPTRDGYRFAGWTTDAQNNSAAANLITVDKAVTLYAHWIEQVTVTYVIVDTDNGASSVYKVVTCDKDATVEVLSKLNDTDVYTYSEWNVSGSVTVTEDTVITATRTSVTSPDSAPDGDESADNENSGEQTIE